MHTNTLRLELVQKPASEVHWSVSSEDVPLANEPWNPSLVALKGGRYWCSNACCRRTHARVLHASSTVSAMRCNENLCWDSLIVMLKGPTLPLAVCTQVLPSSRFSSTCHYSSLIASNVWLDRTGNGCGYISRCVLMWVWLLVTALDCGFCVCSSHTAHKLLDCHSPVSASRLTASTGFQM